MTKVASNLWNILELCKKEKSLKEIETKVYFKIILSKLKREKKWS